MMFLNPTYLWSLLALAVPVIIHLWSKKEGKVIQVGSLKLLQEADSKQSSRIQLNEWLLLLLRLLIIALLACILAGPRLKKKLENKPLVYVIEPSLLSNTQIMALVDTLEAPIRLLQPGFPAFQQEEIPDLNAIPPNYWQLASEMETLHADSIVVFTNAFQTGFNGMRPTVKANVNWVILDEGKPETAAVEAIQNGDEIALLAVSSDSKKLIFNTEKLPLNSNRLAIDHDSIKIAVGENQNRLALDTVKPLKIILVYEEDMIDEVKYMQASFSAIANYLESTIILDTVQKVPSNLNTYSHLVWLSSKPVINFSGQKLIYKPDSLASDLISHQSYSKTFYLTQSLNAANTIDSHLPEQLLAFLDFHPSLEEKIKPYDKRVVNRAELLPRVRSEKGIKREFSVVDSSKLFWIALVILLFAERILAHYRKQ